MRQLIKINPNKLIYKTYTMAVLIICLSILGAIIMLIKASKVFTYFSIKIGVRHSISSIYFLLMCCSIMIWLPAIYNGDNYHLKKLSKTINKLTALFYVIVISVILLTHFTYDL
ncbi:MAG: hypothetical protein K0R51_1198 [Cytophagaceae bacterium]|jgi:hypothetical protein|nr:hypothetical protein [Cytophagaceae bacterium]